MSLPLTHTNAATFAVGDYIYFYLTSDINGIGHSSHPQFFKSPAHMVCRNDSGAVFDIVFDGSSQTCYLHSNSTTVAIVYPTDNYVKMTCLNSTAASGTLAGCSNIISIVYYFPGEPLPHPMGR